MPLDTFPISYGPSMPCEPSVTARVNKAQFGDGYSQRSGDGINNMEVSWSVQWQNLTHEEADDAWDFLMGKMGYVAFLWTPPRADAPQKFTSEKFQRPIVTGNTSTLAATFILQNDPD